MSPSFFNVALATWRSVHAPTGKAAANSDIPDAVVKLSIKAIEGARTADTLGAEREGTGVVIDASGLILTVGYLVIEAGSILVVAGDGRVFPAHVIGFDHATGYGLLRASPGITKQPLAFGDSEKLNPLTSMRIITHESAGGVSAACVVSRRRFTGWWEYMIDGGIFTAPPRFEHSGAALLEADGKLAGIGSLWVSDAIEVGAAFPGNMFVPIDLLKPRLEDLLSTGRSREPARPWLGVYSEEIQGHVVVTRVLADSPAAKAGLTRGGIILGVEGEADGQQSEFYQRLWATGEAGSPVVLHVLHKRTVRQLTIRSMDRMEFLRPWPI